ncbi:multicopper oxidase domain-containing protein [Nakamurella sp. YIM 132087]|uniref:Multicopper oxidase CueO n=1 Tax=Nakamurella alba TaxID=2665158 RepID=A0A7K1FRA7_9ACTN|nr:multicopper oxidase domain-containing protein [Nakamurella alba]MTD16610.1 multicopper oxidase domain-containing protein [Nakamurella alba]
MTVSRRQFLGAAGAALAAGAVAGLPFLPLGPQTSTGTLLRSDLPLPPRFTLPLTVPPEARLLTDGPTDVCDLRVRSAPASILPGVTTRITGYDGLFPGPTIRTRRGRPLRLRLHNDDDRPTVLHLHGGRTPPDSDGYPTDLVRPGTVRSYDFPLRQRAAGLWYHDHTMDFTGPQVYRGLAGHVLHTDDEEGDLGLPAGEQELPLLLCDRAFDADGQLKYPARSSDPAVPGVQEAFMGGVIGDVLLVNGVPSPVHEAAAVRYRLRLLNACNARRLQLELDPPPPGGAGLVRIGTDGGLLGHPLPTDRITLASGERADVIVDLGRYPVGTDVVLRNTFDRGPAGEVLLLRVVRAGRDESRVPDTLSRPEPLDPARAEAVRTFAFRLERTTGGSAARDSMAHSGHGMGDPGTGALVWTVNGLPFGAGDVATPRLGATEIWRFSTDLHHPVHLHLAHFQVLGADGRVDPDQGWKDTLDLLPGATAQVVVRFDGYRGRYVLHCHNLEHEDMAMMADFTVV